MNIRSIEKNDILYIYQYNIKDNINRTNVFYKNRVNSEIQKGEIIIQE